MGFAEMYLTLKAFGGLMGLTALELHLHGFHNWFENAHWVVGVGTLPEGGAGLG